MGQGEDRAAPNGKQSWCSLSCREGRSWSVQAWHLVADDTGLKEVKRTWDVIQRSSPSRIWGLVAVVCAIRLIRQSELWTLETAVMAPQATHTIGHTLQMSHHLDLQCLHRALCDLHSTGVLSSLILTTGLLQQLWSCNLNPGEWYHPSLSWMLTSSRMRG